MLAAWRAYACPVAGWCDPESGIAQEHHLHLAPAKYLGVIDDAPVEVGLWMPT